MSFQSQYIQNDISEADDSIKHYGVLGMNVTDLPLLGNKYNGKYITNEVVNDRMKNLDKSTSKRY